MRNTLNWFIGKRALPREKSGRKSKSGDSVRVKRDDRIRRHALAERTGKTTVALPAAAITDGPIRVLEGAPGEPIEGGDSYGGYFGPAETERDTLASRARQEKKPGDILDEFEDIRVTPRTDLGQLEKPLRVWAFDDSIGGEGVYQYKTRVGVFNPIAGHDWFSANESQFKDQVVLWSSYSEPTAEVKIADMIHFFPVGVSSDDKGEQVVDVQVSKYFLGRWRSEKFKVSPGQSIGEVVENDKASAKSTSDDNSSSYDDYFGGSTATASVQEPDTIDFGTNAVLVDVKRAKKWTGAGVLNPQQYADALYTLDGVTIEHVGVGKAQWPSDMRSQYDEVDKDAKNIEPIVYLPRGKAGMTSPRRGTGSNMSRDMMDRRSRSRRPPPGGLPLL